MNTYHIKLDLAKGYTNSLGNDYGGITLRQGDKQGCTIVADLYDHGERFTQAGLTAFFVMDLPDHAHYYRAPATYSSGTVTITINEQQAASATGTSNNAYFELLDGDTVIASTRSIRVLILPDARGGKTPGETYDTEIEKALEDIADAIEAANEAAGSVGDAITAAEIATQKANEAADRMGYNAYLDWDVVGDVSYLSVVVPDPDVVVPDPE